MAQLGDRVRDRITGFEGIVVGVTDWLYNCRRPIVQPTTLTDGKIGDTQSFDEDQLEVIEAGAFKVKQEAVVVPAEKTGGPMDTPTRQATPSPR